MVQDGFSDVILTIKAKFSRQDTDTVAVQGAKPREVSEHLYCFSGSSKVCFMRWGLEATQLPFS